MESTDNTKMMNPLSIDEKRTKMDNMKHAFSIEMTSPSHVRSINFSVNNRDRVLFEGSLGELQRLGIVDSVMLEIVGANGVLRIDLTEKELYRHLFMNTLKNNT